MKGKTKLNQYCDSGENGHGLAFRIIICSSMHKGTTKAFWRFCLTAKTIVFDKGKQARIAGQSHEHSVLLHSHAEPVCAIEIGFAAMSRRSLMPPLRGMGASSVLSSPPVAATGD
jgi:hypothetical protein